MAQNIYDDDSFFAGYSQLPRSAEGLDAAAEWPWMQALLPPMDGARVVDLGCGFGYFCRWVVQQGAAAAHGIDLSQNMLRAAADATDDERVTFERQDLDALELPAAAYDLAYSSLTMHYLTQLDMFLAEVVASLVPGGAFVCSVEHPLFTAPTSPTFVTDQVGRATWPLDRYLDESPRTTDWLAPGVVKQHRTIATYVNAMIGAGLTLAAIVEWGPTDEQIEAHPDWAVERERPPFLLLSARRD